MSSVLTYIFLAAHNSTNLHHVADFNDTGNEVASKFWKDSTRTM